MLNLSSANETITIVTGSACSLGVQASWTDLANSANLTTPGGKNSLILSATTTTVVPAPAAGIVRNVKFLSVQNQGGTSCEVAIRHVISGVSTTLFSIDLLSGYTIQYTTDGDGFRVYDANGNLLVTLQGNGPTAISAGTQFASSGTIVFANSNGVTFGMSDSSVITASFAGAGPPSINFSAGTTSNNLTAVTFFNSNNVSFGLNASTITASASFAQSTAPGGIAAGTQTATSGTVLFSNSNGVTFGMSGSSVVTASVASSLTAINVSAGTTSNNLSAITFANSNGISFGLNASTLTASVATGAALIGTISVFSQDADFVTNFTAYQNILSFQKLSLPMNLRATQLAMIADFRGTPVSSDAVTLSHAVYTLSGGTASLASSGSRTISWPGAGYSSVSGTRYRTMGVSYSMTPGDYLFAWAVSTANGVVVRPFGRAGLNLAGTFDGVETSAFLNGSSVSSAAVFPGSIAATNTAYARTGFSAMLQPGAILLGT
jgi:hypothetical protein